MLVDHLLLALGAEDNDEAVKTGDNALHLKAVHKEHGDGGVLLAHLVEDQILQIFCVCHNQVSFSCFGFFGTPILYGFAGSKFVASGEGKD